MGKIWQKDDQNKNSSVFEKYTTGDDYLLDLVIMGYDIKASKAHAKMLNKINILTEDELNQLLLGLDELSELHKKGEVEIKIEDEDCHTVIEKFLTDKLGDIGKKIHTGRSRNDQVLTAVRLYLIDELKQINVLIKRLTGSLVDLAEKNKETIMPGYTHTQQAMLSSVAHWSLSFAEALINDYHILENAILLNNQNPLGTAAAFGVTFDLDRDLTAQEMGFDKNIVNSLSAQASRGKFESAAMEGLSQIMLTLSRLAADLLFFTARETGYFTLSEGLTTGSSIMPQKKNADGLEIMRGYVSVIISHQLTVKNIIKSLISGYNRDLQLIKKPLIESLEIVKASLIVADEHIKGLRVNKDKIETAIAKDIVAADLANEMVEQQGIPFRDAYVKVGQELEKIEKIDYLQNIKSKKSLGSPGNLNLEYYRNWLNQ